MGMQGESLRQGGFRGFREKDLRGSVRGEDRGETDFGGEVEKSRSDFFLAELTLGEEDDEGLHGGVTCRVVQYRRGNRAGVRQRL